MAPRIGHSRREQAPHLTGGLVIQACEVSFQYPRVVQPQGEQATPYEYLSIQAPQLSPFHEVTVDPRMLRAVRGFAFELGADGVSDRQKPSDVANPAPGQRMRYTEDALDAVARQVKLIQEYIEPVRYYLDTSAGGFRLDGEMSAAEFFSRLLTRTGCGWLLDITGVYAQSINWSFDPFDFLAEVLPAAQRVQLHLGGGFFDEFDHAYVCSAFHPVPEGAWDLYRFALAIARRKIDAIIVERDEDDLHASGWQQEIRLAGRMVEQALAPAQRLARV